MRLRSITIVLAALALPLTAEQLPPIAPASVVVLYNSGQDDSRALAEYYAKVRGVPEANLVGLPLPETDLLSREAYDITLRDPLRRIFEERWPEGGGNAPEAIRVLLTVRGVPFGIERTPPAEGTAPTRGPNLKQDEASVDSELALLTRDHPLAGTVPNPYFRSKTTASGADLPGPLLTARLDGPSFATCRRLIDDALATEKSGLWGRCYLDFARKPGAYAIGDTWLTAIAGQNLTVGIPTVADLMRDTFVTNYPLREAALYYGWYAPHRNGPLLNGDFRFKRGAVAVHIHSSSAAQLRNPDRHWCGPLLEAGAAATLGNVFEPFLQLTPHLDILHDRLLRGHSLVEAASMATPALSWQTVLLGDPLYRPFARFHDPQPELEDDRDYRSIRHAWLTWPDDPETRTTKLRALAAKRNSGTLYEALGLFSLMEGKAHVAHAFFGSARRHFGHSADRLRLEFHTNQLLRQVGHRAEAVQQIRGLQAEYAGTSEARALEALLLILDPPAPPPAQPREPSEDKQP